MSKLRILICFYCRGTQDENKSGICYSYHSGRLKMQNRIERELWQIFYLLSSDYSFTDIDTVLYTIPKGYKPETVLSELRLNHILVALKAKKLMKWSVCRYTKGYYKRRMICGQELSWRDGVFQKGQESWWRADSNCIK